MRTPAQTEQAQKDLEKFEKEVNGMNNQSLKLLLIDLTNKVNIMSRKVDEDSAFIRKLAATLKVD